MGSMDSACTQPPAGAAVAEHEGGVLAVAAQVAVKSSKGLKPEYHLIGSRVEETGCFQATDGSTGFNLYKPTSPNSPQTMQGTSSSASPPPPAPEKHPLVEGFATGTAALTSSTSSSSSSIGSSSAAACAAAKEAAALGLALGPFIALTGRPPRSSASSRGSCSNSRLCAAALGASAAADAAAAGCGAAAAATAAALGAAAAAAADAALGPLV
jgi:hypothetical protein